MDIRRNEAVFADTSFYIAASNPSDALHAAALALARRLAGRIITTDFVLVELGNWLSRSGDRPVFIRLMRQLASHPQTEILPANRDLFDRGFRF